MVKHAHSHFLTSIKTSLNFSFLSQTHTYTQILAPSIYILSVIVCNLKAYWPQLYEQDQVDSYTCELQNSKFKTNKKKP